MISLYKFFRVWGHTDPGFNFGLAMKYAKFRLRP